MPGNKSANGTATGNATALWRNARLATFNPDMDGIGAVENAVIAVRNGRIAFAGPESDLPADLATADDTTDCGGRWITPALIDCHTHLVFGGNRAMEFEMRLNGATYEEIAKAGGGIVSSVRDTRALSEEVLVAQALPRLDTLLSEGISTVEIKSGYGLDIETELKMLRVARRLETLRPVRIVTSYLAAHATPADYKGRNADYIGDVVLPGLEKAHAEGLADAVDGFAKASPFPLRRSTGFSRPQNSVAFRSSCMRSSFPTLAVPSLRHPIMRCRPITWNILMRPVRRHWRKQEPWPCFFPAPFMRCAKAAATGTGTARCRSRHCARNGLQPRHFAAHLPAADHEYGRHAFPHDRGRVSDGDDTQCGKGARPACGNRHAGGRKIG